MEPPAHGPPPRPRGAPRQLGLFGALGDDAAGHVDPAPVSAEFGALAARLPATLRLGTSSWAFAGWRGLVYAATAKPARLAAHGLAAYARHPLLGTVGIDRTFYAPMPASGLAAFAAAVPASFRFLVKALAECTTPAQRRPAAAGTGTGAHYLDAAFARDVVVGPAVLGLGERLGVLVFQFPPQGRATTRAPERFAARLHEFFAALPQGPAYAVELRDPELLTAAYAAALRAANVQHCYCVHPAMPTLALQQEVVPPAGPVTVRWMLHQGLDYEAAKTRYEPFDRLVDADPARRAAIVALCDAALAAALPVTIVVNNKAEGSAPLSVFELARAFAAGAAD